MITAPFTESRVHITLKSANGKVGPIPVTTTDRHSCPETCPLKKKGCYADGGPLAMHWNKVTSGERGGDWSTLCDTIAALPAGQAWRHNQAGDLPHIDGLIDADALAALVDANTGRKGWTYTHHDTTSAHNVDAIRNANRLGFAVNLSANGLEHADQLSDLNAGPVVTILPIDQLTNLKTPAGRAIVICPAVTRDDVSCSTCMLCANTTVNRPIVGFPAHGSSKKKAQAAMSA